MIPVRRCGDYFREGILSPSRAESTINFTLPEDPAPPIMAAARAYARLDDGADDEGTHEVLLAAIIACDNLAKYPFLSRTRRDYYTARPVMQGFFWRIELTREAAGKVAAATASNQTDDGWEDREIEFPARGRTIAVEGANVSPGGSVILGGANGVYGGDAIGRQCEIGRGDEWLRLSYESGKYTTPEEITGYRLLAVKITFAALWENRGGLADAAGVVPDVAVNLLANSEMV